MSIKLPALPYSKNSLAPYISEETIDFHYGKHHKAYVDKLNTLTEGNNLSKASLEEIVLNEKGIVFNQAAQVWNHNFYWECLSPSQDEQPSALLLKEIEKNFSSLDNFKNEFTKKALSQFGSGWAWLVKTGNSLKISTTGNAELPLTSKETPLLTCDVWEHAYYVDYRNNRGKYLEAFWKLINWKFVEKNLDK